MLFKSSCHGPHNLFKHEKKSNPSRTLSDARDPYYHTYFRETTSDSLREKHTQKNSFDAYLNVNPHSCCQHDRLSSKGRREIGTIDTVVCVCNRRRVTLVIMWAETNARSLHKRSLKALTRCKPRGFRRDRR